MGNIQTRGHVEELAISKLEAHGWTVVGGERRGVDLDLFVQFDGISGKVFFRNAFNLSQGMAETANSDPCSVWIELGEPVGEPTWWSLWDQYRFGQGSKEHAFIATIIHEAIGIGWTKVAGGDVEPGQTWRSPSKTLDTIISRAACLAPSRNEADRRYEIWKKQRHNFGSPPKKHSLVLFLVLLAMPVGVMFFDWLDNGKLTIASIVGPVLLSILPFIFLLDLLKTSKDHLRRPRNLVAGVDAVVNAMRITGVFDVFKVTTAKLRHGLPVVVRSHGYLDRHHQPHGSPKSNTKGSPARAVGDKGIHINDTPHVRWMFATRRIGPVDSATPGHRGPVDSRYGVTASPTALWTILPSAPS